jgi:hypothetical protein
MIHLKLPVRDHLVWFCTKCETTWAVINSTAPLKEHIMFWSECAECGDGRLTSFELRYESLELAIVNDILAALPYDLLAREFLIYLEEYDNACYNHAAATAFSVPADRASEYTHTSYPTGGQLDPEGSQGPP